MAQKENIDFVTYACAYIIETCMSPTSQLGINIRVICVLQLWEEATLKERNPELKKMVVTLSSIIIEILSMYYSTGSHCIRTRLLG